MCEVEFTYNKAERWAKMTFKGHCEDTAYCNAVSTLMYTLITNLRMIRVKLEDLAIDVPEGEGGVFARALYGNYGETLHTFIVVYNGLLMLKSDNPDEVNVITRDGGEEK